jgi:hypothetical protein
VEFLPWLIEEERMFDDTPARESVKTRSVQCTKTSDITAPAKKKKKKKRVSRTMGSSNEDKNVI